MKKSTSSDKRPSRGKRILALIGVVLLIVMYLLTLIAAFMDSSDTMALFKVTVLVTVLVPVLLWAYGLIFRVVRSQSEEITFENDDTDEEE